MLSPGPLTLKGGIDGRSGRLLQLRTFIQLQCHTGGWMERVGTRGWRWVSEPYSKAPNSEFVNMATVAKYQFRQCTNTAESSSM